MDCTIERHGLGRDGHLGDLYDAYSDQFTGENLFLEPLPTSFIHTEDVTEGAKMTRSYSDHSYGRFDELQLNFNSQLNLICQYHRSLPGSGQYLIDNYALNEMRKTIRKSIIYTVPTKMQEFNPFVLPDVIANINVDAIKRTRATHVVTKIKWGANSILTLKGEVGSMGTHREFVKKKLVSAVKDIMEKFSKWNRIPSDNNHLDFSLATDIGPHGYPLTSVEEALIFMRNMPDILEKFYNSLGKPLVLILVPVHEVMKLLKLPDPHHSHIYQEIIANAEPGRWVGNLDYSFAVDDLFDLEERIRCKNQDSYFCDYPGLLHDVSTVRQNAIARKAYLQKMFAKAVLKARVRSEGRFGDLNKIVIEAWEYTKKLYATRDKMRQYLDLISTCEDIWKPGVLDGTNPNHPYHFYTGGNMCLEKKENQTEWKAFVLITRSEFKHSESDFWFHLHFFMSLKNIKKGAELWIVDLDRFPQYRSEKTRIAEVVVRDMELCILSEDYFKDTANNGVNLMYADRDRFDFVSMEQPTRRAALKIPCPGINECFECDLDDVYWHCMRCREKVEYGFDNHFYCRCGKVSYKNCWFRCNNKKHGGYINYDKDYKLLMEVLEENYYYYR